jgi:WD40 repeat protein
MDGTARLWDAATGQVRFVLRGHAHVVEAGAFSPDGKWIGTASKDGTARIWNATTGQEWLTLPMPQTEVTGIEFAKESPKVMTVSSDGVARIWPIDPLPIARSRKPRELTEAEKARFQVDQPEGSPAK